MLKRFRALYGAGPLHLLALLASFAIAGAAVVGWFQRPRDVVNVLEWFAAAIVLHDLVLLPLYSLLDRIAFGGARRRAGRDPATSSPSQVDSTPYLRIPAILSGILLLVFFPVILGLGAQAELSASGIIESGYLARWLLATGVMFAISGIAYATAVTRTNARAKAEAPPRSRLAPAADADTPGRPPAYPTATDTPATTTRLDSAEPRPRELRHPRVEILSRLEAQHPFRQFGRREHMPDISEPELAGDHRPRRIAPGRVGQRFGHLADRPRCSAGDVKCARLWVRARQCDPVRTSDIANVDKIP